MEKPSLNPDLEARQEALVRAMLQAAGPERMSEAGYAHLLERVRAVAPQPRPARPIAVRPLLSRQGWAVVGLAAVVLVLVGLWLPDDTAVSSGLEIALPGMLGLIVLILGTWCVLLGLDRALGGRLHVGRS